MASPPIKISSFREEKLAATRDVCLGVKENECYLEGAGGLRRVAWQADSSAAD